MTITFIGTPTIPGMLTFSRKRRWRIGGGREPVCPGGLKTARRASPMVESAPLHLYPEKPLNPP